MTVRTVFVVLLAVLLTALAPPRAEARYRGRDGFDMHYQTTFFDDATVHRAGWGAGRNFDRGLWGVSAPMLFCSVARMDGVTRWAPTGLATMLLYAGTWHGAGAVGLPQEIAWWPLLANGQIELNPSYGWKLFAGTQSDLYFTEEDEDTGMTLMLRAGVERRLGVVRLAAFVGVGRFWIWDGPDEGLGTGFGLRLSAGRNR